MYLEDYNHAICNEKSEETLMPLLWDCNFSIDCWVYYQTEEEASLAMMKYASGSLNFVKTLHLT